MFNTTEMNLMILYNPGTRLGLMEELGNMLGYLSGEETGLRRTTVGVIRKLQAMTDEDFDRLDLDPSGLCVSSNRRPPVQIPLSRTASHLCPASAGHGLRGLRGLEKYHAPLCAQGREGHCAAGYLRGRAPAALRL